MENQLDRTKMHNFSLSPIFNASRMRGNMSKTSHRVTRQTLPMRCSTWTANSVLAGPRTCSRPWHILQALLEFSVSEFFGLEVEMRFYACTREVYQTRSIRFEATIILRGSMPGVLAAASSKPLKQSVITLFSDQFLVLATRP